MSIFHYNIIDRIDDDEIIVDIDNSKDMLSIFDDYINDKYEGNAMVKHLIHKLYKESLYE